MRTLLLTCLLAASAFSQTGSLGVFTNSGDVGSPAMKGSTEFDAAKGQYKMIGAGANIWAKEDQFQYVWKPGKFKLKLVRQAAAVAISIAKDGAELKELGHTQVQLGNPILVGLAISSHNAAASDTVIFSDVSVEALPTPPAKKK